MLFAVHLDRLGRDRGVRAFSVHPGAVITPLGRPLDAERLCAWSVERTGVDLP